MFPTLENGTPGGNRASARAGDTLPASAKEADVALGASIAPKVLATAARFRYLQTPGTRLERLDLDTLAARCVM